MSKIKELKKSIKGVFVQPIKKYYFGKVALGCPYMFPRKYCSSIIRIKTFKPKYSNLKYIKVGKYYIFIGVPITIRTVRLGWKDKFDSPRYEWSPQFHIYIFGLQFAIFWNAPDNDNDKYYEMILQYLYYAKKDIVKAKETWGWVDYKTNISTWEDKYIIKTNK